LCQSSTEASGEGSVLAGLDLDLGHLQGAESDIGEDFSRGRASKPDERLVLLRELLASEVRVGVFEDFIETVFEHPLERVADKGRPNTLPDTGLAFLLHESSYGGKETGVLLRVDLCEKKLIRTAPLNNHIHTCILHFATSRGVMPAWVKPQARTPPSMHLE
jgi:hypothetical protein